MGKLFVMVFALLLHLRQIRNGYCTRTPRICTQSKSCTVTVFWLRDSLYCDIAPVPSQNFVTGDNPDRYRDAAPIKLVPMTLAYDSVRAGLDGKNHATPSFGRRSLGEGVPCTVTAFTPSRLKSLWRVKLAKVPGPCPDASSGSTPTLQAGPVKYGHREGLCYFTGLAPSLKLPTGHFLNGRPLYARPYCRAVISKLTQDCTST